MKVVTAGHNFRCTFGTATAKVVPQSLKVLVEGFPVVRMTDVAFLPFGTCVSTLNPANIPIITSPPCTPLATPWQNISMKVVISGIPVILASSTTICLYAGVITPVNSSQKVLVSR